MNTEGKKHVAEDARPQCSTCDGSSNDVDAMPPSNPTRVKRLETSEDIERALHIAPTRSDRTLHRVVRCAHGIGGHVPCDGGRRLVAATDLIPIYSCNCATEIPLFLSQ